MNFWSSKYKRAQNPIFMTLWEGLWMGGILLEMLWGHAVKGWGSTPVTSWPASFICDDRQLELESKWILMKHLVYPRLSVSYSDLLQPSDWKCTFQLQSHGKIWVRDYSFPNTRDLTDFIITIIKPSNINVYILISFSRQFLISRNPHTLVLFMSVKKSREAKINKSTDFLIGFL